MNTGSEGRDNIMALPEKTPALGSKNFDPESEVKHSPVKGILWIMFSHLGIERIRYFFKTPPRFRVLMILTGAGANSVLASCSLFLWLLPH